MTETAEKQLAPFVHAIQASKSKFNEINAKTKFVDYAKESMFALQAVKSNDYLMKIANDNPNSLRDAIINTAAIGISLNPAEKLAYLVPRKGHVFLDISYMGLIKLATDTGSIKWARAELIHENDEFIYKGATERPEFATKNPFNRGAVVGVYCVAKTHDNDYLSGIMSVDELHEIRNRSEAYKKGYGPWVDFEGEMMKKTIIKRESKTWPKTQQSERFEQAIDYLNNQNDEGINFNQMSILGVPVDEMCNLDNVNEKHVEACYQEALEILEADTDEPNYDACRDLDARLNDDENMIFISLLGKHKEGRKKYSTIWNECLKTFNGDHFGEIEDEQ